MKEIKVKSIGYAKNRQKEHYGGWAGVVTDLIIKREYRGALKGLKDYSHLIVIFWASEVKTCKITHVPQGKAGRVPEVGIFACRCLFRPNPIGVSLVKILKVKDNVVKVVGLDVINQTPILDIKPYTPQYDEPKGKIKVPSWVSKLDY